MLRGVLKHASEVVVLRVAGMSPFDAKVAWSEPVIGRRLVARRSPGQRHIGSAWLLLISRLGRPDQPRPIVAPYKRCVLGWVGRGTVCFRGHGRSQARVATDVPPCSWG